MPREIFGPKSQKAIRDWRKLRNEELHNLYSTSNIIQVIKPKTLIWTGHVVRTGGGEKQTVFFCGGWEE